MNLLIVEDEECARQSLASLLQKRYPQHGVRCACDGEEALKLAELFGCDVVLADIQMPRLDGLALLERLRALSPRTLVVVVSAYDYFYYAQRALQLGAFDYILKPFTQERLESVMDRALALLGKRPGPRTQGREPAPVLSERPYLGDAACGRVLLLFEKPSGSALPRTAAEWETLAARAQDRLAPLLAPADVWCFPRRDHGAAAALATYAADPPPDARWEPGRFREAVRDLREEGRPGLALAAGPLEPMPSIVLSQVHAEESARFLFYEPGETVFCDASLSPVFAGAPVPDAFAGLLRQGDAPGIRALLTEALERARRERVLPRVFLQEMESCFSRLLEESGGYLTTVDFIRLRELCGRIGRAADAAAFLREACALLEAVGQGRRQFNENKNAVLLEKCIAYIQKNYGNPELSLQAITERFYFNPAYFSSIFKKQTGQTIMQYLTTVRIRHAQELLRGTGLPLGEVAQKVGYPDIRYFMRVFKSETGMTPGTYRKREKGGGWQ